MQQNSFDFPDSGKVPRAEPSPKARTPKHHSTSICHYCGVRVPAWTTRKTPQVDDEVSWTAMTPYHGPNCSWVLTRGRRLDEGGTP
jgi:hypothetical protein